MKECPNSWDAWKEAFPAIVPPVGTSCPTRWDCLSHPLGQVAPAVGTFLHLHFSFLVFPFSFKLDYLPPFGVMAVGGTAMFTMFTAMFTAETPINTGVL